MESSASARATASPAELTADLRALGVRPGGVLLVHMSYRAVRPVEGGPSGVIEALRAAAGDEGTIVMPSWSGSDDEPFDPARTPACPSLGVTAEVFRRLAGVRRSAHPFAFAALGPHAAHVTADPLPLPPHRLESPVGRVYELDGQVLLLGVGHDANTTVHLAEVLAGAPYAVPKHCTVFDAEGGISRVPYQENDHCCARFALVDGWLRDRGLQREGPVGHATARLVRSADVVDIVSGRLRDDPLVFLHAPDDECAECDAARETVPRHSPQPPITDAPDWLGDAVRRWRS